MQTENQKAKQQTGMKMVLLGCLNMFPIYVTRTISFFARVCLPVGVSLKERTGAQSHSDGTLPTCLKFSLMDCCVLPSQLGDFKVLHKKDFTHTKQRDY